MLPLPAIYSSLKKPFIYTKCFHLDPHFHCAIKTRSLCNSSSYFQGCIIYFFAEISDQTLDCLFLRYLKVLRLAESFIQLLYQESLPLFQCLKVFYNNWCRAAKSTEEMGNIWDSPQAFLKISGE